VTAAASGFTTGGLDANKEKIMQASTITAPSSSTATSFKVSFQPL